MKNTMPVAIRSAKEIERIRAAGRIVGQILRSLTQAAVPGATTAQLAQISDRIIEQAHSVALFKGVKSPHTAFDFPSSICASVNEQLVHGIPSDRKLCSGDILSLDCGVKLDGYCGDAATTIMIGDVEPKVRQLVQVTSELLEIALTQARPGRRWSEIAGLMQQHAERAGFGVVRDYVGHGIGRKMHEDPKLPNFVSRELLDNDLVLRKGMIMAVEPMVNMGSHKVRVDTDGWTVVTVDSLPAAHFEATIAITKDGAESLTTPD